MWALLMGRHERCGGDSLLRSLPGDGIAWKRIAEFACAPVSHVDPSGANQMPHWNNAPVTLAPDPRRGVVARAASGSTVGVARLRVLSFTWDDRNSYEQLRVTDTLGLVAQHCRELRALRLDGPGGGESLGDDDGEGAAACRAAITSVLDRCVDLRVLMVIDCCEYSPTRDARPDLCANASPPRLPVPDRRDCRSAFDPGFNRRRTCDTTAPRTTKMRTKASGCWRRPQVPTLRRWTLPVRPPCRRTSLIHMAKVEEHSIKPFVGFRRT